MPDKSNETLKPTTELLKRLSLAVGVTGYGGPNNVQDVITAELRPYADRVERDRLGSIVGIKLGVQEPGEGRPRRKIMLAAHLDEIGAVVTQAERGFLRFYKIGGLDERLLMGQEVIVHGRRDLPGVIGSIPPHFQSGSSNHRVSLEELHIDVGLPADEVNRLVRVGDLISFIRTPAELQNGQLSAKAMDNRSSVAAMIVCLKELQRLRHTWDVYAAATANEEWGDYLGATTQAYALVPDVALVIDVTFADVKESNVKLDAGPVITLGPSNHPGLRERVVKVCQELEMKYQTEITTSGRGTDVFAIEVSREGVPSLLIGVPSRYMHSPVEVVHPRDVERIGRLMAYVIASLDEEFVTTLIPD